MLRRYKPMDLRPDHLEHSARVEWVGGRNVEHSVQGPITSIEYYTSSVMRSYGGDVVASETVIKFSVGDETFESSDTIRLYLDTP